MSSMVKSVKMWCVILVALILGTMTGNSADIIWSGAAGDGKWSSAGNWSGGVPGSGDVAIIKTVDANIDVTASTTVKTIKVTAGTTGVSINIGSGVVLTLSNSGSQVFDAAEDCVINGPGSLKLSTSTGVNYADIQPNRGKVLTINAPIVANGDAGVENNSYGILRLTNPASSFTGEVIITTPGGSAIEFTSLGNIGVASPLGKGSMLLGSHPLTTYRFIGDSAVSSDRIIQMRNTSLVLENEGTAPLTMSGSATGNDQNGNEKRFILGGNSSVPAVFSGIISNGLSTVSLGKVGSCTWTLSGNSSATGNMLVSEGVLSVSGTTAFSSVDVVASGVLEIANVAAVAATTVVQLEGGVLKLLVAEPAMSGITVSGPATIDLSSLSSGAELPGLSVVSGGMVNLVSSVPVYIDGAVAGALSGVLLNGMPAAYDAVNGVVAGAVESVPALGPYVIESSAGLTYMIDSEGSGGGITLQDPVTTILGLSQLWSTEATIAFDANQVLDVGYLKVGAGSADLILSDSVGKGVVQSASNTLALDVAAGGKLTVNAAVADSGANALDVSKAGEGEAVLKQAEFSGRALVDGGTLVVDFANAATLESISGSGELVKQGSGNLSFNHSSPNFTGPLTIEGGVAGVANSESLGASTANRTVKVKDGGAIDVGLSSVASSVILRQVLEIEGSGPDGKGALLNSASGVGQNNAFQKIRLTGDASIGGNSRIDIRYEGANDTWLDLAGNKLSKISTNYFAMINTVVTPDSDAKPTKHGGIDVDGGMLSLEYLTDLGGSAVNQLNLGAGSMFILYGLSPNPVKWTVNVAGGSTIRAGNLAGEEMNVISGPVNLGSGITTLDQSQSGSQVIFDGKISGSGGLKETAGNFVLNNRNNDYSGGTTVTGGNLYPTYASTLPGVFEGDVAVTGGALVLNIAESDADGWTAAELNEVIESEVVSGSGILRVDTGKFSVPETEITEEFKSSLSKKGAGDLILKAPVTSGSNFEIDEGAAIFDHDGPHSVGYTRTYSGSLVMTNNSVLTTTGNNNIYLGDSTSYASLGNIVGGDATLIVPDKGYSTNSGKLIVGQNGNAVLDIADNARVEAALLMGHNNAASGGAIYQSGNSVFVNTAGASNDGSIGTQGYAHYWLQDGVYTNKGYTQIGKSVGSYGVFRQTGGKFVMPGGSSPAKEAIGDNYGGNLVASRLGNSTLLLLGGETYYGKTWNINGDNDYDTASQLSFVVFGGSAHVKVDNGSLDIGRLNHADTICMLTLEGDAIFEGRRIYKHGQNSKTYLNFNGGTFRMLPGDNSTALALFTGSSGRQPTRTTLYGKGITFDIPEDFNRYVDLPLLAPRGNGLVSFELETPITGYYAPPFAIINGHGGTAGHIDPVFDRATGAVTGFKAYSPGFDYPSRHVTVTLKGGGKADTIVDLKSAANISGGLTKIGGGTLTLTGANTYTGATRVKAGALGIDSQSAISYDSEIEIGGSGVPAILSLGGNTITNRSVTIRDGGAVIGGNLVAKKISKVGSGIAAVATELSVVPGVTDDYSDDALVPGFQEGMLRVNWVDNSMNPGDGVQLTTVAGNGTKGSNNTFAGGRWQGNNHTWIYTGYVWNRSGTNETWRFRASFDDNVSLWMDNDDSATIARLANTVVGDAETKTITPGPHLFRIYFGDGTGDVGNNHSGVSGVEIDTGDGAGWRAISDPGDGSFVTVSKEPWGPFWRKLHGEPSQPGLWEGALPQSVNTVDPNPMTSIQATTRAANGQCPGEGYINGFHWTNHTVVVYTGYIWNHEEHDVEWTFAESFDDTAKVVVNGDVILCDVSSSTTTKGNATLKPGPNFFEARLGQRTSTAGLSNGRAAWWPAPNAGGKGGLLVDYKGRNSENIEHYEFLANPETGLPIVTTGPALPGSDTSEALEVEEGTLVLGLTPGLYEGMINQAWNTTSPNPKSGVQLTTVAGNGAKDSNSVYSNGRWISNNHTWIYTGYLWNRGANAVTWTFWGSFDDHVRLTIDGVQILDATHNSPKREQVVLTPGPHAIEVRYGDGSGDVGPAITGMLGGLVYNPNGGDSSDPNDYILLVDPGDGSLLTTEIPGDYAGLKINVADGATLDLAGAEENKSVISGSGTVKNGSFGEGSVYKVKIDGENSSCINLEGVNLANLKFVPADSTSAEPPYHTYLIATGSFTGKPALEGFPEKYKVQVKAGGSELYMTSQYGTVLLLR